MQPKNLRWKFAFVGLLVAMGVYSIWAKELRLGIDLRGGHVLTFEIQTPQREKAALKAEISKVAKQIEATADPKQKSVLKEQLASLTGRLADVTQTAADPDLVAKVIKRLKERIDPRGLYSLEWRAAGRNRFVVRMPLGTAEAQQAKRVYQRAMRDLSDGNIQRSEIRRICRQTGAARAQAIRALSADDPQRAQALTAVATAYDRRQATRRALAKLQADANAKPADVQAATDQADNAEAEYRSAVKALFDTNVDVERLGQALGLYVARRETRFVSKSELAGRRKAFDEQLAALCQAHPSRAEQIRAVSKAYIDWSEKRTGLDDPADLKRLVARMGVLEFRIAPTLPGSDRGPAITKAEYDRYVDELAEKGPLPGRSRGDRYQWFEIHGKTERFSTNLVRGKHAGKQYLLLHNADGYTMLHDPTKRAWSLRARPARDDLGRPAVGFTLDAAGPSKMGTLTSAHKGHFMAILLDNQVYSAPVLRAVIYARGVIEGDFTRRQVAELIRVLNAGSLEAQVKPPVRERTIEPSMGRDNREKGVRAAMWGLIGVAGFMIVYYLAAGAIANVALLLNIVLVLGAMSFLEAVFTLPGIAGIILTIGMAVDANVLIFERLREEQTKTQSMRMAIRNAYANAASAILDGNVTTLITCLILGWVGTEAVRGFAITLGLGVTFSLFTSLLVTRWVFQVLLEAGWAKKHFHMLTFVGTPTIDWMKKRRVFWTLSAAMLIVGVVALIWQGRDVLGLEFSSGAEVEFRFKPGAMIAGADGRAIPPQRGTIEKTLWDKAKALASAARAEADRLTAALAAPPQRTDEQTDKLNADLQAARYRAEALPKLAETAKVETLKNPDKAKDFIEAFDADGDRKVSAAEAAAGKVPTAFVAALDANGDGTLTRDELEQRLPEPNYQVSTTVADVDLLRDVVWAAYGESLQMQYRVEFTVKTSGRVGGLGVELAPDAKGMTHIDTALEGRIEPEFQGRFTDFIGGAMFVLEGFAPALTEAELAERIQTMRGQPDFATVQFNRTEVIGLTPAPDGGGYTSAAVLVLNPAADFAGRPEEWTKSAADNLALIRAALRREQSRGGVSKFDPAVAGETANLAIIAFVMSWLAIIAYLWLRFGSARWGLAAVVCLIHDVIIAVGLVAVTAYLADTALGAALGIHKAFKIDMAVVAAFLTIIGYSVNDTIVVFDRIRENRGKLATVDETILNRSINQTLSRTLLTTTTTLIAVVVMYVFGGEGIHAFTFALLIGILFGTYSSIAIASPLLLGFKHAVLGQVAGRPGRRDRRPTTA